MDLLDYLTQFLHCNYLSDLHFASLTDEQADAIRSLDDARFSLSDYRQAVEYITGRPMEAADEAEARQLLVDALRGHGRRR